jgi:hypothetical protein
VDNETRVFVVDPDEIDRYARAIARIVGKGLPAGSDELERAVNTYGTAFQFLVMRRGAEYGRALAMAAGDRALALVESPEKLEILVAGDLAVIHERVCIAEEEAREAEQSRETDLGNDSTT